MNVHVTYVIAVKFDGNVWLRSQKYKYNCLGKLQFQFGKCSEMVGNYVRIEEWEIVLKCDRLSKTALDFVGHRTDGLVDFNRLE